MSQRIVIIHDYFITYGGAEKTVEAWLELYPEAVIHTGFFVAEKFRGTIFEKLYQRGQIKVTSEQIFFHTYNPTYFKMLFWLHPIAAFFHPQIRNADLILISSVYSGKYFRFKPGIPIVHYCHSPTRFLYPEMRTELDHSKFNIGIKIILAPIKFVLRIWDQHVTRILAKRALWLTNSPYNQKIIENIYHITPQVMYPPIDIYRFAGTIREAIVNRTQYVMYGRVVQIKHVERAVLACIKLKQSLIVIGDTSSPEYLVTLNELIEHNHASNYITVTGDITDADKMVYFSSAIALLFPALEDFGIAPIEVLGAGVPIIAIKGAGALEYVQQDINGVFFEEGVNENRTITNLVQAMKKFDISKFPDEVVKNSIKLFDSLHKDELQEVITRATPPSPVQKP